MVLVQMQDRHAEEAQGGAGGPAGLTKEKILGRIAAYEIAFGIRPNGRRMPTFSGYFSGRMGVAELHDEQGDEPGQTGGVPQVRLAAYHQMDANRREWSGDDVTRYAALDETLKLFDYGVMALNEGIGTTEDRARYTVIQTYDKVYGHQARDCTMG